MRKLGKPTDQRLALLKNQASYLLWYGRIETTLERAKEVRRIAEKMLTLAINTYKDEVTVKKIKENAKGEKVEVEFKNDGPQKLNARRKLLSSLVSVEELRNEKESKAAYKERTKDIADPLIEKLFNEYAPKYADRNSKQSQGGGYTRIYKLGVRRGDAAEMAVIELV